MFITGLLIGVGLGLLASALLISVYELTTYVIKKRVKEEIPEAEYVTIEKTINGKDKTTLPEYKAKAYNKTGKKIRDIDFEYEKSEYFYDGEKIHV